MNILIIGGTGLISAPMTRYLLERGHRVTHYNRQRTQAAVQNDVPTLLGDRTDYATFEAQMREREPFDCVIDMICYDPKDAESLARAFAGRTQHLIVCSTVDVYHKPPLGYPITEAAPHKPSAWDYAQKKAILEGILQEAQGRGDFPLTIIRPAHTYGEGRGLVHTLGGSTSYFDRLRKGKPLLVHGDGSAMWCSCHCEDVARAFVEAVGNPKTYGKTYHTTGEEWLTWNAIHRLVAEEIGAPPPELVHIPTDVLAQWTKRAFICAINFQYNNIFDNAAARADLHFRYTIPLREGVRRIVAWLDAHGKIENSDLNTEEDRLIAAWNRRTAEMVSRLPADL